MANTKICQVTKCPEKTYGRLRDKYNTTRRDLCKKHFESTLKFYNTDPAKPTVFVTKIWENENA